MHVNFHFVRPSSTRRTTTTTTATMWLPARKPMSAACCSAVLCGVSDDSATTLSTRDRVVGTRMHVHRLDFAVRASSGNIVVDARSHCDATPLAASTIRGHILPHTHTPSSLEHKVNAHDATGLTHVCKTCINAHDAAGCRRTMRALSAPRFRRPARLCYQFLKSIKCRHDCRASVRQRQLSRRASVT